MVRSLLLAVLFFATSAMALKPGELVPDVAAKNQNGKTVNLSKFKGQFVLLYFYPKDETPGCTTEAQNFQADLEKYKNLNAVILGVSRQDEASHQKFIAKHGLKFDLLVDKDGKLGEAFGVGSIPILGLAKRQSALIGPDGKLIRFYDSVNPKDHSKEVLEDIKKAKEKS